MAESPVSEPEEWRPVPGHPGYEASSLGRVRSLDRWIEIPNRGRGFRRGIILRPQIMGLYTGVALGKLHRMYVHVAICTTFHGPRPSKRHEAAHWNGNRLDNRAENLRWVTHQQNEADKIRHGTNPEGRRHGMVKLTEVDVLAIRKIHASGSLSQQAIADQFNISRRMIGLIVARSNWTHLP